MLLHSTQKYYGLDQTFDTKTDTLTFTDGKLTWNHTKKHPIFLGLYLCLGADGSYPDDPSTSLVSVEPEVVEECTQHAYFHELIIKHVVFSPKVNTSDLVNARDMFKDSNFSSIITSPHFADHITNMHKMFYDNKGLTNTKYFKNWNVSKVKDFVNIFGGMMPLDVTSLKHWQIKNPKVFQTMFGNSTLYDKTKLKGNYDFMK